MGDEAARQENRRGGVSTGISQKRADAYIVLWRTALVIKIAQARLP